MINKKTFELLDQLEALTGNGSRTAKMEILKTNKTYLQEFFDIAVNPYRVYHVQKIPKTIDDHRFEFMPSSLETLAEYLEAQKGGTTEMKNLICKFLQLCELKYGLGAKKWCVKAILKEPICGLAAKTLNKCGYNLPVLELLLAEQNKKNSLTGIKFPCFVQPKLDGCRTLHLPSGQYLGRNGRQVANQNIHKHIQLCYTADNLYIDGEFYSHSRNFNEIVGYFRAENKILPDDIKLVLFNAIPKEEWDSRNATTNYTKQLEIMDFLVKGSHNVEVIENYIANNEEELWILYDEFLKKGYEGAIVRNMNTTYAWKRVKVKDGILVKLKPSDMADVLIKNSYEGEGRHKGSFGGFICDFNGIEVRVGGGFSDKQRTEIWNDVDSYIDQWARVSYNEITPDGSLRFPVFDSLRDGK